jgi:AcrR family transcriptional regulator
MPRAGLTVESVVAAGAELADAEGLQSATLAALAERLGVRAPSLYAHVASVEDLRERIGARGARELAEAMQMATAGRSGSEALAEMARAYRGYARVHPGTYEALQRGPSRRAPETEAQAARAVEVVLAVLAGYGLAGERALHAVRVVRSALHGFVSLEAVGGFGLALSVEETFTQLVEMLDAAMRSVAPA